MYKLIVMLLCSILLSGCFHSHPGIHRGLMPKNPSPEELIIGGILIGGLVAIEIVGEQIKEHQKCDGHQDCAEGFICNQGQCDRY